MRFIIPESDFHHVFVVFAIISEFVKYTTKLAEHLNKVFYFYLSCFRLKASWVIKSKLFESYEFE